MDRCSLQKGLAVVVVLFSLVWSSGVFGQTSHDTPNPQQAKEPGAKKEKERRYAGKTEITVSAPAVEAASKASDQGTTVVSVGSQQVEDLNAQDLAGSLRRVPGVVISRYNPIGSYGGGNGGAVYIRGHGTGRPGAEIATMIDGIPVFSGVWTHPLLDLFPVDAARSIDVYKSPEPVLFGNMAFGVVNLVPKSVQEPGQPGRLEAQYGSFDTRVIVAEQGGRSAAFDYYVVGSYKASHGHRTNADGRVSSGSGRLGLALSPNWSLALQVHHMDSWGDDPGEKGTPKLPVSQRFAVRDTLAIATLSNSYGRASGLIKIYRNEGDIDWRQWDMAAGHPFLGLTHYHSYGVKIQERLEPWKRGRIIAGFDHGVKGGRYTERHIGHSYEFADRLLNDDAPYLMLSQDFGRSVVVTPSVGARYDASDDFEDEWGTQAALTVRWGPNRVHAGVSRSFNYPGLWTAVMYDELGRRGAWKDLRAEIDRHAEVGYGLTLPNGFKLDLTCFHDRVERALRFVPPPPFPPSIANIGDYTLRGGELEVRFSPARGLSAFLGGSFNSPIPEEVPDTPRWTLTGGIVAVFSPRLRIAADAQYVDKRTVLNPRFPGVPQKIGAYFILNAKVSYAITSSSARVLGEIFVAGENMSDRAYEFQPGYPMPGASGMAGLNLRW